MREQNLIHHEPGPFTPAVHPENFLPVSARETLRAMRDAVRDGAAAARGIYVQLDTLFEKTAKIRASLDRNARENRTARNYSEEKDPVFKSLSRQLADAESEIARLEKRLAEIDAEQRPRGALVSRVEAFVAGLRAPVAGVEAPAPKLARGETAAQAVVRLRGELARLREDRQSTLDAPIPSAAAKKIARDHVLELAAGGGPDVLACLESGSPPAFAMRERERVSLRGAQAAAFAPAQPDAIATLSWLLKDTLIAALENEIDRVSDDKIALTDEQRAARLAEIDCAILSTERSEEVAIRVAELEHVTIARRADAAIGAVLGVETI